MSDFAIRTIRSHYPLLFSQLQIVRCLRNDTRSEHQIFIMVFKDIYDKAHIYFSIIRCITMTHTKRALGKFVDWGWPLHFNSSHIDVTIWLFWPLNLMDNYGSVSVLSLCVSDWEIIWQFPNVLLRPCVWGTSV